ncbi:MAG: tetratricopeptide repeat protein [Deltaproteobacteria bacterium]|nr:tetratricopeptide repeat protein [Deltaproteobacteria bacterium]
MRWCGWVWTVAGVVLASTERAHAADSSGPNVEAQAIFAEARKLDEAGDLANACALYREALRLEPNAVGGRLHLARCLERIDKLASAAQEYAAAERSAAVTNQAERASHARKQQQALAPRLGSVVLDVPRATRATIDDLEVKLDGGPIESERWGQPIFADAGRHVIAGTAPGRAPFEAQVLVRNGERVRVEVPILARKVGWPVWPWIVGGLGLAMGAGAGVFAYDQAKTQADVDRRCNDQSCDTGFDPAAANARLDRDFGLALGLGIGGGLALGAGIVGLVVSTGGSETASATVAPRVTPWVGPGIAGLAFQTRFQ